MPTTNRRPAAPRGQGSRLRQEILEVTARLLEEHGDAAALSLRAVAREVGVAATSIYLHFDSLGSLVRAVKNEQFDELSEVLVAAMEQAPEDPRARLRAMSQAYFDFALDRPGTYKVMFSTTVALPPSEFPSGENAFALAVSAVRAARGSDDDVRLVAAQLWCLMHGMVLLRSSRPQFDWPDRDTQLDDLVHRMVDL